MTTTFAAPAAPPRSNEAVAISAIEALDLEPIKFKLMHPEEGEGWTCEETEEVERWYRRFLILHVKHPEKTIVPTRKIDDFWHYHILDTRKYADDCRQIFGRFLHHFPYFGMRGEEDAAALKCAFGETRALFEAEFGESPSRSGGCRSCGSSCASCNGGSCR